MTDEIKTDEKEKITELSDQDLDEMVTGGVLDVVKKKHYVLKEMIKDKTRKGK